MRTGETPLSDTGPAGRSRAQLLRSRMQRHHLVQFLVFGINGLVVAVVYSVAVWSFIAVAPRAFALDVVLAYAVSVLANYLGARLIFKPVTSTRAHVGRYLTVVAGNFLVAAAIAWFLHDIGSPQVVAAYAPVVVTAIPTFLLMRWWVFPQPGGSVRTEAREPDVELPGV